MPRLKVRIAAAPLAIVLSLILATDAAAITWTGNRTLTASGQGYAFGGGLAVSSSTVAHAIYEERVLGAYTVFYRRSANSGTTWGSPIPLSSSSAGHARLPSIDALGNAVDAVWVEGADYLGLGSTVAYRRSTDGGITWEAPIQISATGSGNPRVLHATSGHVLVTWTEQVGHKVYLRLSTDSGASFGPALLLATTTNHAIPYRNLGEGYPTLAAGLGVIYIAYFSATGTVRLRRSTDGGSTWSRPVTIATHALSSRLGLAAIHSIVLVGFIVRGKSDGYFTDTWTAVRRSMDKGAHWGPVVALSPEASTPSFEPVLTYRAGAFRAVYEKCTSRGCSLSNVIYRSSKTGSTWSLPRWASFRHRKHASPGGVDVATKVLILYNDTGLTLSDVYVRQGL